MKKLEKYHEFNFEVGKTVEEKTLARFRKEVSNDLSKRGCIYASRSTGKAMVFGRKTINEDNKTEIEIITIRNGYLVVNYTEN